MRYKIIKSWNSREIKLQKRRLNSKFSQLCRNVLGLPGPHWVLEGPSAWPGKNPSPKRVGSFSLRQNYPRHSSQSKVDEHPLKKLYLLGGTRFG